MTDAELSAVLGGWEGYELVEIRRLGVAEERPQEELRVTLRPSADRVKCCDGCGEPVEAVHDCEVREVRDLPIFETPVWLDVPRCRLACPRCGPKLERLAWLERYARITRRLAESVARLCRVLPIDHAARFFGLSWHTVQAIDRAYLERTLGPIRLDDVELIAIDEFAIRKGHRYATVIVEVRTKRVLWLCRGRKREDLRPFFELLGPEGRRRLKAVAMDMNGAYAEEVRYQCPLAEIVYDLFHVVAKYGREVIDRVRVDEANRLRESGDKQGRAVVKSARWLLLRNRENIPRRADRIKLDELLAANRKLAVVYVLKDDLKHLWDFAVHGHALRFWEQWYSRAVRSRIEPLKKFALNLKTHLREIISHCQWPLHTSLLEGINNKIKVLKRMAYGFRDDEYFFLKIRDAFPGIRR